MFSKNLRRVYTQHIRRQMSRILFRNGVLSTEDRRDLLNADSEYLVEIWDYGPQEIINIQEPTHIGKLPEDLSDKVGRWKIDAPFVAHIENAILVGPDAFPIVPNDSYVLEAVEGSSKRATDAIMRSILNGVLPIRRSPNSEFEVAVPLAGPWSDQFFHWFVEYLPRLLAVRAYLEHSFFDPVYLVPSNRPAWLTRSLELVGLSEDRIISWNSDRTKIHHLLLPSLWRHTESTAPPEGYVHSPRGIREVSDRLKESIPKGVARDDIGGRLYISRSDAPTRNVVNEKDLHQVLDDYGFDVIHPERWTLDEQIATFAKADVIAGPHGGGLTNTMYASDPTVIELFGNNTNPCYFALFAGSGWDYGLVNGESIDSDIRIEPDDFRQLCDRMLS